MKHTYCRPTSTLRSCAQTNVQRTRRVCTICIAGGKHVKTSNSKRQKLVIVAGEQRSANRTAWSAREETDARGDPSVAAPSAKPALVKEDCGQEVWSAAAKLQPTFAAIDELVASNIRRVQAAFAAAQIGPHHFAGSTGYGHGDIGRAALDEVMAAVMGTPSAIVRNQFVSGTHAIAAALFACLRPGDELLAVAGRPYDTLEEVIGLRGVAGIGSLKDWGVAYRELPLLPDGGLDFAALRRTMSHQRCKAALIQRSCGYSLRPTLSISEIEKAVGVIREVHPECLVLVDNCYGEFTEEREPGQAGANLVMGSLIKSPGGTLATGGGYVAGRKDLVEAAAARLTAPGVGLDAGCVSGETLRLMFQGLFLAPQMVGEALKGGRLVAEVFHARGAAVFPPSACQTQEMTPSFITAVRLGSPEAMETFSRAVQRKSPVGSYVRPVPGQTSGYEDEVIFADGTFIDGSTAELSADGPFREPYVVYCQGGTHWTHWALVLEEVLSSLKQNL